jgi:hypothetical protein
MTLPASGAISFNNINVELCRAGGAQLSLNDSSVRTLFGQASGAVCMNTGHGKSNTSVPGAPTIGSASSTGTTSASVSFSAPASNGGLTIDYYQAISSPGCITATGTSPISVTGLSSSTSYTFKVRAHNSKGYGCYSGSSNSITTATPATYLNISTLGACVYTSGNYKTAIWYGNGSFTVNSLGSGVGNYGYQINSIAVGGGGGGGSCYSAGGGGGAGLVIIYNGCLSIAGGGAVGVTTTSYSITVGAGGIGGGNYNGTRASNGSNSYICGIGGIAIGGGYGGFQSAYGYYMAGQGQGSGGGGAGGVGVSSGGGHSTLTSYSYAHSGGSGGQSGNYVYCCCSGSYVFNVRSYAAGGGGGAGGDGVSGTVCGTNYSSGGSGISTPDIFTGAPGTIAGGGGGMTNVCTYQGFNTWYSSTGVGGSGVGGNGFGTYAQVYLGVQRYASNPTDSTGSGGGGGSQYGFGSSANATNGSRGFVAIRWRFQ